MKSLKLVAATAVVAVVASGCCLDPCGILGCIANTATAVPTRAALASPAFGAAESVLREAPPPGLVTTSQRY